MVLSRPLSSEPKLVRYSRGSSRPNRITDRLYNSDEHMLCSTRRRLSAAVRTGPVGFCALSITPHLHAKASL